jgi:hypothetical protein
VMLRFLLPDMSRRIAESRPFWAALFTNTGTPTGFAEQSALCLSSAAAARPDRRCSTPVGSHMTWSTDDFVDGVPVPVQAQDAATREQ